MSEVVVVGEFEWIVDFDYLEPFFHSKEININDYENKELLVIGCGTSNLSYSLLNQLQAKLIVSLDNDQNCIQYMREKYCEYQKMKWIVYDLVEHCAQEDEYMKTAAYDLVIDKGTLDAVLVEGSIATMLCEIYRVLKPGGIYFLCSLHCPELLEPLFTNSPLEMDVTFLGDCGIEDGRCQTVALCRKRQCAHHYLDLNQMISTEKLVMDIFYQETHPLVTEEEKEKISLFFQFEDSLSFQQIHDLVFHGEGALLRFMEYSYDLFIEDLKEFPFSANQRMTYNEFIEFLSSKQ
jgi:SAM-dependent methyltransferase